MKNCIKCNIEKEYINFSKDKSRNDGYSNKCKICYKEYQQQNKEIVNKATSKWSKNNKEQRNEYFKNRKLTEPLFKLRCNLSTLIWVSLKRNGYSKNSKTYNILGCTISEFKQYLENKFTKGMNWQNNGEWHLDHIYPTSLAKDKEELLKLNHYTNFQPLWAVDNIKKGNKII
jgi:hypothetical protein